MNSKTSCAPAQKTTALYNCPFFRKLLHSRPVAHAMARLLGPRRCGRLTGRLLLPFVSKDKINVLAVSREMLAKDTEQIENRTDINFIPWRSAHLGRLIACWTPKECQIQTNFIPDESYRNHICWANGVTLLKELFAVLEQKAPVPVAVTANVDYWQEEPLRRFCTETGVQHLVIDRENHIVQEYRDFMRREYDGTAFRFQGHAAVFSDHMKDLLVETSGCSPDQVTVTGAPRMDVWLDDRPSVERDTVTFLSFRTSLLSTMNDEGIKIFIDVARNHPELQFVIKCKEGRGDYDHMKKLLTDCNAPANVRPEQYINMRDLLDRSKLITGFNTISLAEALLTDVKIVIPSWEVTADTLHMAAMNPDDPELAKEILFARTKEQFTEQLEQALSSEAVVDREARLKLVNRYMMFTPGETASERTAKLIAELAAKR